MVSVWSAFAVSVCVFNATSKMPPKKLPRLEKGRRTLSGSASSKGGTSETGKHHDIKNIQNCLAEPRHSKQAAGCQAGQNWASGSSWCLEGSKAQGRTGLKPQTSPPLTHPPPSWLLPTLTPPPTNTLFPISPSTFTNPYFSSLNLLPSCS